MTDAIAIAVRTIEAVIVDGRQSENARMVQRGVGRMLVGLGFSVLTELPLASGRRADVTALSPAGEVWIVEIKSSIEDFRADRKWPDYRLHCDRLFFATHADVPLEIFPEEAGLILADGFGAAILRDATEHRLAPATRKAMTLRFAHVAARRFHQLLDPGVQEVGGF
ncbi:MmcB family DNA repair protein [Chthonobacter albigriseus]|uniref:MmcB family DNA repair protein n=1 Tax=Chthonobacter albigriseus TaxID=1683161 RepID=UPI0015EF3401|nr:MmcB family DNA repair protein [Chthonobacter albigriseus]